MSIDAIPFDTIDVFCPRDGVYTFLPSGQAKRYTLVLPPTWMYRMDYGRDLMFMGSMSISAYRALDLLRIVQKETPAKIQIFREKDRQATIGNRIGD